MAKGFKNYSFEFDKNELKFVTTFCKQMLKETDGRNDLYNEARAFRGVLQKIEAGESPVKFTKDEYTRFQFHLKQNVKHLSAEMGKAWFLKRWLYKSLVTQYQSLLTTHFKD